jgi:signal transduction histidine kinase
VVIDVTTDSRHLSLRVNDDGLGFELTEESTGHGLINMQRRAQKLGGTFQIDSTAGKGTTLRVEIPLLRSRQIV